MLRPTKCSTVAYLNVSALPGGKSSLKMSSKCKSNETNAGILYIQGISQLLKQSDWAQIQDFK